MNLKLVKKEFIFINFKFLSQQIPSGKAVSVAFKNGQQKCEIKSTDAAGKPVFCPCETEDKQKRKIAPWTEGLDGSFSDNLQPYLVKRSTLDEKSQPVDLVEIKGQCLPVSSVKKIKN